MVFWKNGIVDFIVLRYLCHKHIFWHFYLSFWARKIALLAKNAINLAKFEYRKLQIKNLKTYLYFLTLIPQRQNNQLRIFSGKIFRNWRLTLLQNWNIFPGNLRRIAVMSSVQIMARTMLWSSDAWTCFLQGAGRHRRFWRLVAALADFFST